MMGGFFSIQQQAVITVSKHYAGTVEHLRSFIVEGDACGLESSAGVKANLLIQLTCNADMDKVALRICADPHPGFIGMFHSIPKIFKSSSFIAIPLSLILRKYLLQPLGVILHPSAIPAKAMGPILQNDPFGKNAHILHQIILCLELAVEGVLGAVTVKSGR